MNRKISILLLLSFIMAIIPVSALAEEETVNLVAGLSYTIETGEPVEYSYANFVEGGTEFDVDNGQLTDSTTALTSESSNGWYRAFRSKSRIVTFDLGAEYAVKGINAGFLHAKIPGIYAPRYINVWLSDDGENYGVAAEYKNDYPLHDTTVARCDISFELDKVYSARYVKVEFSSDIFTFCDEIEVMGYKELLGDEAKVKIDPEKEPVGYLASLSGVTDIIKLYNGYYQPSPERGILTQEKMLPYIAYLDTDGNIAGKMFDAVAFVPCHGDYPSGGRLVKTNNKPGAIMSDWELYFEYTFKEGQDVGELDKLVGTVYGELGIDEKYKVFLTVPYPTVIDKPFGDIDGDGTDEYCRTLEERVAIAKWFIDKCINQFNENKYENIELAGFYWLREEVNYTDSDHEAELAYEANKYIKEKKLTSIFDPFYLSTGFDHWEELGFSGAVMQPNVAFPNSDYFDIKMLGEFAQTVYNNHLGVEIETNEPSYFKGDDYLSEGRNYESYLYYGYKTGYINSLKTYYQGAGPGSFYDFCYADISTPKGIYLRRLYDLTYSFINGTYKNEAPVVEVEDIELVAGDKRVRSTLTITDDDSYWGDITVEFPKQPAHGRVTSASNKSLIYSPDDGYVGSDSFTVIVSDGFNNSEEITVNVTVSAPEDNESEGQNQSSQPPLPPSPVNEGMPPWLFALLGVLGVAILGVAAAMIVKHTKKK